MMASDKHLFFTVFASCLCVISACYDDDLHVIKSAAYQGLVLDGSRSSHTNLQYFTNSSTQLWKFQRAKPVGFFYIINYYTGKALDIHPADVTMALVQRKKMNTKRQQWSLKTDGRITNRENNRNFDVTNGKFTPGNSVGLWHNNGDQAQEFVVESLEDVDFEAMKERIHHSYLLTIFASFICVIVSCPEDDIYVIRSGAYQGLVLDGNNPSLINIQYFTNSTAQLWAFQRAKSVGLFYIVNQQTGKVLDCQPGANGFILVTNNKTTSNRQQWSLTIDGRIVNSENKRNADILDARFFPGTQVILWDNNGNQAQEFVWAKLQDVDFDELNIRVSFIK